jgi:hypothetical protein
MVNVVLQSIYFTTTSSICETILAVQTHSHALCVSPTLKGFQARFILVCITDAEKKARFILAVQ